MRKIHIPRVEASFCCSAVSNCSRRASDSAWAWLANLNLPDYGAVVVRVPCDYRGLLEVVGGGRRGSAPCQSGCAPGICGRDFAVAQRPDEIDHRDQVADGKHGGSGRREDVQNLEFFWVGVIAARHPE